MSNLIIESGVPRWAHKWITACKNYILPDWEVEVHMGTCGEKGDSSAGSVSYKTEYLIASIYLDPDWLANNAQSRYHITHEFTHPTLSQYQQLIDNVFEMGHMKLSQTDYNANKAIIEEMTRQVDEITCVKLSRSFTKLISEKLGQ